MQCQTTSRRLAICKMEQTSEKNVFSRLFDDDDDDDDGNGLRRLMNYKKMKFFSLCICKTAISFAQTFVSRICADLKKELMILFSFFCALPAQTITDREKQEMKKERTNESRS